MVSVCAFHRVKTTDEADNFTSNLNKDNFALRGSCVQHQAPTLSFEFQLFLFLWLLFREIGLVWV